jgi:hypothetical protein
MTNQTGTILKNMGDNLTEKIYYNMGNTVNKDELDQVNIFILNQDKNNSYGKDSTYNAYQ